ncbi:uncharacterized protein LAESUDRAFT_720886 [Laetiporus sulphureus 93-53]|uniref:Protein N-terminal glutamine amidohydrolase n=1 Tax=Laetiporus sulphureus 93-53 TaxID=1314785 RepID=A0A165HEK4_9APHY|nr:uncharacterized protein LAESUDRAFT_720886 [Laetiporus sulphureus 93-53]KZT11633.1 hypothetical protein LAESUDRAFT_720886 [Laetiporus sulphureus 93-53]
MPNKHERTRRQTHRSPPPLPPDSVYTSCYCEENIYLLAQAFAAQAEADSGWSWDAYVVFISNDGKTVALWNSKADRDVVVWDYHVVLVLRSRERSADDETHEEAPDIDGAADNMLNSEGSGAWVYDFDTRLPNPCRWAEYVCSTFPYAFDARLAPRVAKGFHPLFRVVPATAYLDYFASDRSHMLKHLADGSEPEYYSAPPSYPALCGPKAREMGVINNLMQSYVTMARGASGPTSPDSFGVVMDLRELLHWGT